ncbi:MAG: TetR/AcrR family transcriptional regulator [Chloroflexota bacterium]|nr:TetR/AcrR family transcriptional regulator [Chloroflexota bacterium]
MDVLDAALIEFATYGLHGASTVNIAQRAGISQPYVLRLFDTKKNLFLEAVAMARRMIEAEWKRALETVPDDASPQERIQALGQAFQGITGQANVLRLLMQAYSAAADDEVRDQCQEAMSDLYAWVRAATGASAQEAQVFFAQGMILMVGVSIGAPDKLDQEWARAFMLRDMGHGNGGASEAPK